MTSVFCDPAVEACMHTECTVHYRADAGVKEEQTAAQDSFKIS